MDEAIDRIRTQRVEVTFENQADAFRIREELSEVCRIRLIPAIEKLFEKYAGGQLISISRLEIDAGQISGNEWKEGLVMAVISQMKRFLDQEVSGRRQHQDHVPASDGSAEDDPFASQENKRRASFILYYLRNGTQAWNSPYESSDHLRSELRRLLRVSRGTFRPARFRDKFARDLAVLLASNANATQRLLYLLPEKEFLPVLTGERWGGIQIRRIRDRWNRVFEAAGLPEPEHDVVFLQALSMLRDRDPSTVSITAAISREIVRVLQQRHEVVFLKLPEMPGMPDRSITPDRPITPDWPITPERISIPPPGNDPSTETAGLSDPSNRSPDDDPVYINNAGLVLLHPFLHHLFENAGHTVKNEWDSAALRQRSIVLTQYLVSGQDAYTEPELFLNKLLTAYPVQKPLPLDTILSDFERKEAEDLLESVIAHWRALKNTGIPAFRETFLQRPGRVTQRGKNWLLQVDQRGADILLGKIPWGFTTIKTPWMDQILTVEWA